MLESRQHRRSQQDQSFVVILGLEIGDECHLARVIGVLAHHWLEGLIQRRNLDKSSFSQGDVISPRLSGLVCG